MRAPENGEHDEAVKTDGRRRTDGRTDKKDSTGEGQTKRRTNSGEEANGRQQSELAKEAHSSCNRQR